MTQPNPPSSPSHNQLQAPADLLSKLTTQNRHDEGEQATLMIDLYESDDAYWAICELCLTDPEQVRIKASSYSLQIEGTRDRNMPEENLRVLRKESGSPVFSRLISFPIRIDVSRVTATFAAGKLEIQAPKEHGIVERYRGVPIRLL